MRKQNGAGIDESGLTIPMLSYKSGKTRKVYVEFNPLQVRVELWNDRLPRPYAHYHPGPESLRRLQAVCQAHAGRITHYDGLIVYDELRGVVENEKGGLFCCQR